jgi:hypothetical protein
MSELIRIPSITSGRALLRPLTVGFWLLLALPASSTLAGDPEYMKLAPRVGLGVEVGGRLNGDGIFVADDIERLEDPRRPKLRGELTAVDPAGGWAVLLGRRIVLTEKTEYRQGGSERVQPGRRVEVSCRIDAETGEWSAKYINLGVVKDSDKVKGTITAMWVDGVAPDTLSLDGFLVLLLEQTDFTEMAMLEETRQRYVFRNLALPNARALGKGRALDRDGGHGLRVQYRQWFRNETDYDLTPAYDSDIRDTQPELRGRWFGYWSDDLRTAVELRLRRKYVVTSELDLDHGDWEFQLRQAVVLWRNVAGRNLALAVGRQKIKEPREWIWDEYLEGVRLLGFGSGLFGFDATWIKPVNPLKPKFTTWTDLHLAVSLHLDEDNRITGYVHRRWDDDESRNREPVWWGLRYLGEPTRTIDGWVDLALMRGEDKHRKLDAWAFDVGAMWQSRTAWRPSVVLSYAYGSGDEPGNGDLDGNFRQTGYEDNSMRFGGVTSVRYYGTVLDPELSNLAILTAGAGVRPLRNLSAELFYHHYSQDWAADEVEGSLVDPPARPNGYDAQLGWGLDFVLGLRRIWGSVRASWTIGIFDPGPAYAPRERTAVLNKLNVTVEI